MADQLTPPEYEASATVAIARVKSDITFDDRYRTLSEEELQQLRGDARRAALLGLVNNSAVAEAVITELGDTLTEDERNPAKLLEKIKASLVSSADGRTDSDLIRILVTTESPDHSAAIANAWARHYVQHVNTLYGSVPAELMTSVQSDLAQASADYNDAQRKLEVFIAQDNGDQLTRLIAEKEAVISSIQTGKQAALQSLIDKELAARQEIAAAYIDALAQNRLLGFEKEQEAKRQIVAAYIDSELESRLNAFFDDRQARQEIYSRLVNAELDSVTAIFDAQVEDNLTQLSRRYQEKQRLESLLAAAQTLREQVTTGGDAAAATNRLAVTLLKTQVLSATTSLADTLQLNVSTDIAAPVSADEQETDLAALIGALNQRLATLEAEISEQSAALAAGDGYQFLDLLAPEQLAVSSSVEVGGVQAETDSVVRSLKDAIVARYPDLYGIGSIAETGQELAVDSELFDEIRSLYPDLFRVGELSDLAGVDAGETQLSLLGQSEAADLLQIQTSATLSSYAAATAEFDGTMDLLETELQTLRSQQAARTAREQQLLQQRDLAWSTFTTLSNKNVELNLSNTAANSEVRFAAPAIPPAEAVEGTSLLMVLVLSAVVGVMMAVFVAFLANFMGVQPVLHRRRGAAIGTLN
ncbi:MAG: hypothetical protein R2873_10920 [Caldilineaceae bacterium]